MIKTTYSEFILEKKISVEIPLPNDIIEISKEFNKANKELFVVGGAVRDFLQHKIPHDFDLVTNALPDETKTILKNWDVSDEQGKNFGVLRIFTEDEPKGHEIATFRKDISGGRDNKGEDQKVEIGRNITIDDDVKRRDLTVNALFYDINKKEIVDLVGGVKDIENNIIRSVGDPAERFKEDRLRILRVFRFAARAKGRKGGIISQDTERAIKNDNRLRGISPKEDVSQERILEEWSKVVEHAENDKSIMEKYIRLLTEYDMWEQMFPKMKISPNVQIMKNIDLGAVFCELFYDNDIRGMRKHLIRNLKFSAELVNQISFLKSLSKFDIYSNDPDVSNVYKLAKIKKQFHIDDSLITNFFGDEHNSFIQYCNDGFVVNGNDLREKGFVGNEIENEKIRLENERFKKNYLNK